MLKDYIHIEGARWVSPREFCDLFLGVAIENSLSEKSTTFCMDKIGIGNRCYKECEALKEAVKKFGVMKLQEFWESDSAWERAKPVLEKIEMELNTKNCWI
jgi:hypothetical protein